MNNHYTTLWVRELRGALFVTLNRPDTRNALSSEMVQELAQVLEAIPAQGAWRALVLRGSQGFFCAGGNMGNFQERIASSDTKQNADAIAKSNRQFGFLMQKLAACPIPVLAAVEGAAMGGGLGLAAAADIVMAQQSAKFALTETQLGLIPAQIAPFVAARIGVAKTRRLGLTGERLNGEQAQALGLVDALAGATSQEMDACVAAWLCSIGRCAPGANRTLKHMLGTLGEMPQTQWLNQAAQLFSQSMVAFNAEGVEGIAAFRAKRPTRWQVGWSGEDVRAQAPPLPVSLPATTS